MDLDFAFCMDLNFASWNVRGLETPDRKYVVKRFLKLYKKIDLPLLQEIKVVDFWVDINMKCVWREVVGKGSVAILLSHKWEKLVSRWGCSSCNRLVWVILKVNGLEFDIFSIYASNDYRKRT